MLRTCVNVFNLISQGLSGFYVLGKACTNSPNLYMETLFQYFYFRDFPGSPEAKIPCSQCWVRSLVRELDPTR